MSSAAEVSRAARAVRGAATTVSNDSCKMGEGHAELSTTTGQVAEAWSSPVIQVSAQRSIERLDRLRAAPQVLLATATTLDRLGETGEEIAARLQHHEDRLSTLQQRRGHLMNDPDPTAPAALSDVESQLSEVRRLIDRELHLWDQTCSTAGSTLTSHAHDLIDAVRAPRATDSYAVRTFLSSGAILRGAEAIYGAGVFATNWVRRGVTRGAQTLAGLRAAGGQLVRGLGGIVAGTWRVTHGNRFVRNLRSGFNLLAAPIRTASAAHRASQSARATYEPRLNQLQSRMDRGSGIVRSGAVASQVVGRVTRVAAVPFDYQTVRHGSTYHGARGDIDRGMAGVGLASAAAGAGAVALKGAAIVGIGAGAVVAAPVLLKGAAIAGAATAVWGLGNLAWDATSGLRSRASEGAKNLASSAKEKASDVGSSIASGANSVVASVSGGVSRLGSVFGGG